MIYINIIRNNSKVLILTLVSLWNLQKKKEKKNTQSFEYCQVWWANLINVMRLHICVLSQTNSQIVVQIHTKLAFYNCICIKTTKTKQIQCKKFELNQCIFAKIKLNFQFVSCSNCTCHFVQSLFDRMKWDWAHQMSDF